MATLLIGYGFIEVDDGSDDVFVHQTSIYSQGFRSLAEGEKVEFDIETDNSGRRKAVNVTGPGGDFVKGQPRVSLLLFRTFASLHRFLPRFANSPYSPFLANSRHSTRTVLSLRTLASRRERTFLRFAQRTAFPQITTTKTTQQYNDDYGGRGGGGGGGGRYGKSY